MSLKWAALGDVILGGRLAADRAAGRLASPTGRSANVVNEIDEIHTQYGEGETRGSLSAILTLSARRPANV